MVNDAKFARLRSMASGLDEEELRTAFVCPTCGSWPLKITGRMTTQLEDSFELSQMRSTNVPYGFQMSMSCRSFDECSGVMLMGTLEAELIHHDGSTTTLHQVLAVWPPLPLVDVPAGAPHGVAEESVAAGASLWMDPDGAAVGLRRIAEVIFPAKDGSKRKLFRRIDDALPVGDAQVLAHGLRLVGNDGAHDGGVETSDVIAAAEMLAHLLHDMYPSPSSKQRVVDNALQWQESSRPQNASTGAE